MKWFIIAVSGTPGTGKSTLAKNISKNFSLKYFDVNKLIRKEKIYDSFDKRRKCFVVDEKKLAKSIIQKVEKLEKKYRTPYILLDKPIFSKEINSFLKKHKGKGRKPNINYIKNKFKPLLGVVIDSHLSHHLPKNFVDLCIITKTELGKLKKRLNRRKYSRKKTFENIQVEIFDVCFEEAKKAGHKIVVWKN